MLKLWGVALIFFGLMYATAPHLLGLHHDSEVVKIGGQDVDVKLPSTICFPSDNMFVRGAGELFQESAQANLSNINAVSMFVSCRGTTPWADVGELFPWGFVAEIDGVGEIDSSVSQNHINAIMQTRLAQPNELLIIKGLEASTGKLNEVATSMLLTLGISTKENEVGQTRSADDSHSGGVLGQMQFSRDGAKFVPTRTIGIASAQGRTRVGNEVMFVRATFGVALVDQRPVVVVMFGAGGESSQEDEIALVSEFGEELLAANEG